MRRFNDPGLLLLYRQAGKLGSVRYRTFGVQYSMARATLGAYAVLAGQGCTG
jgi:hypothetical protein